MGVSGKGAPIEITQKASYGLVQTLVPRIFTIVVTQEEEGGFTAYSPEVKGARSQGETKEELIRNMFEVVGMILEARGDHSLLTLKLSDSP